MSELARRYAKALYENMLDEERLLSTRDLLKGCPPLWRALLNPCVAKKQKQAVLRRVLSEEGGPLNAFYALLCRRDRLAMLDDIAREYHHLFMERQGAADATVRSAFALDEEQKKKLAALLCRRHGMKRVVLHEEYDAALLGGFQLKMGDFTYDWSVRGALRNMQKRLQAR